MQSKLFGPRDAPLNLSIVFDLIFFSSKISFLLIFRVILIFLENQQPFNFHINLELSITLTTRWANDQIKLISDPNRLSSVNLDAKSTFIEQQKW